MKKFFVLFASLALATPVLAQDDIFIPPAQPSEQILMQGVVRSAVESVQFHIAKDDSTLISNATLPDAGGRFYARLENVPCGTSVPVRAIAKTADGRKIKSKWYKYQTSECKSGNDFARHNPARQQTGNDYNSLQKKLVTANQKKRALNFLSWERFYFYFIKTTLLFVYPDNYTFLLA